VDEAAEAVVALDLVDGWCTGWLTGFRGLEFEGAMRPLRVVVVDEDAQDAVEVAAVEDRQPVGAFGADGSNEPFGDGVCLRCPHGRLNDPDAAAAQHLVEAGAVVAVAVTVRTCMHVAPVHAAPLPVAAKVTPRRRLPST
jgi:hypothetical protein